MKIIYEPRGAALEYSPLAVNIYKGCLHGCKYCYVPKCLRTTPESFHATVSERKGVLDLLKRDCEYMRSVSDTREVLLCFTTDPYQPSDNILTRQSLEIFDYYKIRIQILTKGGMRAARDFDLMKKNDWKFATTLLFCKESSRKEFEPNAASISDRVSAIKEAHELGIQTWVSVEPVIYPDEALYIINKLFPYVDFWKVGKINHNPELERGADWKSFAESVKKMIPAEKLLIKNALRKYLS